MGVGVGGEEFVEAPGCVQSRDAVRLDDLPVPGRCFLLGTREPWKVRKAEAGLAALSSAPGQGARQRWQLGALTWGPGVRHRLHCTLSG